MSNNSLLDGFDLPALDVAADAAPAAPGNETEAVSTLATSADIADALDFVAAADVNAAGTMQSYDATNKDSTARGIGSITHKSGGKVVSQRVEFVVAKMDETTNLRQRLIDEGKLTEYPTFTDDMAAIINPVSARTELRPFADLTEDLAKLEALPGTRPSYPHMANAAEDVAQTILRMCRNPADAEMIAAIASCLPDYMRHQQKQRHITSAAEAHADAVEKHVAKELQAAIKRLEFRSGLLTAGGDAQLAQDLAAWQKRGNNLSIKSNLSSAPHLIPLLQYHDAKELSDVLCEIAQYIPENGHRFKAVVMCPDSRHKPAETYTDSGALPEGFSKAEVTFNFQRIDASTVHITLRERILSASTWSQSADLNPFVMVGAWDVYGSERCTGQIAADDVKVSKQRAADIAFLKGEAESAGAVFEFPDLWNSMRQRASSL